VDIIFFPAIIEKVFKLHRLIFQYNNSENQYQYHFVKQSQPDSGRFSKDRIIITIVSGNHSLGTVKK